MSNDAFGSFVRSDQNRAENGSMRPLGFVSGTGREPRSLLG